MVQSGIWTGCVLAIAFLTGINAQSSEDVIRTLTDSPPTTTRDSLETEIGTVSLAAPTGTGQPCGRIASAVESSTSVFSVAVPAELAYECLTSVPVNQNAALGTIDALVKMVQFQSNLAYIQNPPEGYDNPPVDIIGGLADIRDRASRDEYSNQYDFEAAIAELLNSARDGHLGFDGPTFSGAVAWRRDFATVLISLTLDDGSPRVYNAADLNSTSDPSPITQIDGEDVQEFLQREADRLTYHDADARWNAMFFRLAAPTYGSFVGPLWYPGPTTTITFENGTEQTYRNRAILLEESSWALVSDGESFYSTFVDAFLGLKVRRETTLKTAPTVPKRLQQVHPTLDDNNADVPVGFPDPFITGPTDVYLNGYFIDHPQISNLAVLAIQTFYTETDAADREFQALVQDFLAEARTRGSEKIIIDLQSNPGGSVFLGYDTFLQFFPNIEPFGGTRFRGHESANIIGSELSAISELELGDLITSPFIYSHFVSASNEAFTSWTDMYEGPSTNGDEFTEILRYNLSDPTLTATSPYSEGITLTGYGDRSNIDEPPFAAEDIIIVTDGICASTCALFVEMMTIQAGVRVVSLGGRPQDGPMQSVGATKGSNVLPAEYFYTISELVISALATSTSEQREWLSVLPEPFPIIVGEATVNFLDNIREGDESLTPTQFTVENSNCRLWLTPAMAGDIIELWTVVADAAWEGGDGGIDESRCVPGSFRQASLVEEPPVAPEGSGTTGATNRGSDEEGDPNAAISLDVRWVLAVLVALLVSIGSG